VILERFGYDRHREARTISTTLQKNALGTFVGPAGMGFNAPAWIVAASMAPLYADGARQHRISGLQAYSDHGPGTQAHMSALAAFGRLMFPRHLLWRAALASVLPFPAIIVLAYLTYSAGIEPAHPAVGQAQPSRDACPKKPVTAAHPIVYD
jgi:hypothetical protein